jgi:PAS domain S-box-containing protein
MARNVVGSPVAVDPQEWSGEYARSILDAFPDAVAVVTRDGVITDANRHMAELTGRNPDELLDTPFRRCFTNEKLAEACLGRVFAGDAAADGQLAVRLDGGPPTVVSCHGSMLMDTSSAADHALITLRDVTEQARDLADRKRIERQLREQNIQLERASQAKDNFLASMSHELRTPLNAIIGFTGTVLMRLPGPLNAEQEHQLRLVQTSGKHLLSIINDLLDLAKIESGRIQITLETVDCRRVANEVVQSLQPLATGKGLALIIDPPGDTPALATADRRALGQILINLINNAIKFTEAGEVRISLIGPADPGGSVRIVVRDTGPGIPEPDRIRIFRAFERSAATAKSTDEGTGLGLHISQKLAELLHATISVSSVTGEGSTFTVSLTGA